MAPEQKIMGISDIVGDIVQVILHDPGELAKLGLERAVMFLKVVGIDDVGIWAAHPNYVVVKVNDPEGNPLPPNEQEYHQTEANFLIRWEQIASVVHFPNRKGFDFPSPFEKHIGFIEPAKDEIPQEIREDVSESKT